MDRSRAPAIAHGSCTASFLGGSLGQILDRRRRRPSLTRRKSVVLTLRQVVFSCEGRKFFLVEVIWDSSHHSEELYVSPARNIHSACKTACHGGKTDERKRTVPFSVPAYIVFGTESGNSGLRPTPKSSSTAIWLARSPLCGRQELVDFSKTRSASGLLRRLGIIMRYV